MRARPAHQSSRSDKNRWWNLRCLALYRDRNTSRAWCTWAKKMEGMHYNPCSDLWNSPPRHPCSKTLKIISIIINALQGQWKQNMEGMHQNTCILRSLKILQIISSIINALQGQSEVHKITRWLLEPTIHTYSLTWRHNQLLHPKFNAHQGVPRKKKLVFKMSIIQTFKLHVSAKFSLIVHWKYSVNLLLFCESSVWFGSVVAKIQALWFKWFFFLVKHRMRFGLVLFQLQVMFHTVCKNEEKHGINVGFSHLFYTTTHIDATP